MIPSAAGPDRWIGVLLAAGRGSRMGTTKQLVPWPDPGSDRTLVAAAFDAIAPACEMMIVVLGHEAEAVAAALGEREFRRVVGAPDEAMYESARRGLRAAHGIDPGAGVMLHPADHPMVAPQTIEALRAAARSERGVAVMPEFDGRGGHPVLVPPSLVTGLLAYDGRGGLRRYWEAHPVCCLRLPVEDAGVVHDLDTPEDRPRV